MAFADFQAKQRINKLKGIVREYFTKRDGQAFCLSDDATFITLVRNTMKDLPVTDSGLFVSISEASQALKAVTDSFVARKRPVLFIERVLTNIGDTSFLIRQFRDTFPEIRIIVMTTTADKDRIMLLHECGADNFVVKPASGADLLDKMAVTLHPPSAVRQLLDKARRFIVDNVGGEAMKITKKVLEVKPDSAPGYVVMGDALRISGDKNTAKLAYERACKYSGDYLEPLQRLVDLAKETDQKEMQLDYLKRLDALSPLNAQRKVEIGQLHIALGNTDAATQVFDNAVSRAFKDAMAQVAAMTEKIAVSLQDSDPVQAEKYLRKCLELKGKDLSVDDITTFNQLGISLRKQGRWQDAITEYKRALQIAPGAEGLYYNIGMAYAEGKDYEAAIKNMQKALSLNPNLPRDSAVLAYNMGRVFTLGYTHDKARSCLEIALELDPGFEPARIALEKLQKIEKTQDERLKP
ncbi:MAG: tetratricopeptide repeat protein [Desulfovibrio sp.]|jgi:tetratricopeptide (TPR) repeat protein|nr:tetratricopeptide repeat protein [Desulfovibrio sp.]